MAAASADVSHLSYLPPHHDHHHHHHETVVNQGNFNNILFLSSNGLLKINYFDFRLNRIVSEPIVIPQPAPVQPEIHAVQTYTAPQTVQRDYLPPQAPAHVHYGRQTIFD